MKTADRKHRVVICSQKSDIGTDGNLIVERVGVVRGWAAIDVAKASRFSRDGQVVSKSQTPTHLITMNYNPDVSVSVSAWVYEHRLKSPPRWFKVLAVKNVDECSRYMQLSVRLLEETDDAEEPTAEDRRSTGFGASDLPEGLSL